MKVLAIDPGFGRCGVAVLEGSATKATLLHSDCVETDATKAFAERILSVAEAVIALIDAHHPDVIALEELYFSNNAKTALRVAETRGMLLYVAAVHGTPVAEFNPQAVKIAVTGYGRATKDDVTAMTKKLLPLPKKHMLDDEYDAIALGLTALAEEKHRRMVKA